MILVTGASGFLGRHLVKALSDAGSSVRALYHVRRPEPEQLSLPGVQWQCCDLRDIYAIRECLENVYQVYHCAAKVSFARKDHAAMIRENVAVSANLVNVLEEFPNIRLLHVSSIASVGRGTPEQMLTEKDVWEESKNNTAYAQSKFRSEMEVWRGIAEGLNAVIVNPAIMLGAGDWNQGSARLISVADREFPYYTEGINGWVDVRDVVRAMILLMNSDIREQRFILSEGNHSYREVFTLMADALGKKAPHKEAPAFASALIAWWNEWKSRLGLGSGTLTRETVRTAHARYTYDNTKFLRYFPHFQYTPLHDTIRQLAQDFQNRC